ncbi:MAG: hypothetical protein CVV33_07975 [Methanomicrobiales archaeon HGW-Methanomicrobiales-4]|nr:MAG: hypothetical protein CVV33_07975 [Methanomicrobiales archaeon HGW-Methanomicrobiales-4]
MSKILVVDDEAIITMQLEERLTAMEYMVVGMAASGEEGVEKARKFRPDLVLMDIVMPGKMNGIEAADIINTELDIPVVFLTAYADDTIIKKAKSVRPYGYIVKPFNEREVKAAIEVALFRKSAEQGEQKVLKKSKKRITQGMKDGEMEQEGLVYLDLPETRTILLEDIFTDIILLLYTDQTEKNSIFKFVLEEGIKKGGRNLFAYYLSTLQRYFLKEIQKNELYTHRIKKDELSILLSVLEKCTESLLYPGSTDSLQILLDFSETEEFDDILAIRNLILSKKNKGITISGIIALNIEKIDHTRLKTVAEGIPRIIVSTGKETSLSFAYHSYPADMVTVVPQSTIDDVVKKLLEPVVLLFLDKPVSGYDIVHEIHTRFQVLIPQARVYTLLHDLQENGYLEIRVSGKSKLYCPTETGKKHIRQRLSDYKKVFNHILGSETELIKGSND